MALDRPRHSPHTPVQGYQGRSPWLVRLTAGLRRATHLRVTHPHGVVDGGWAIETMEPTERTNVWSVALLTDLTDGLRVFSVVGSSIAARSRLIAVAQRARFAASSCGVILR